MTNLIFFQQWFQTRFATLLTQSFFVVDTFFVIGGFVLCWNQLRDLDRSNGKINFPVKIIKRYLRVIPSLMASILFVLTILKYLGSGPLWYDILSGRQEPCRFHWWKSMLFIQNYTDFCYEESWYLAVDFQLFCISIFLVFGVWKWGKKFIWALALPVAAASCIQFYTIVVYDFRIGGVR